MHLISTFLLAISSNVDNLTVAIAYGEKKIKLEADTPAFASSYDQFYKDFSYESFLEKPEKADKDKSGYIDAKESIALALGLTVNNLGSSVGGEISGFNIAITTFLSFIFSMLAILVGYFLGERFTAKLSEIWVGIVSGCLLTDLGIYEYFIP